VRYYGESTSCELYLAQRTAKPHRQQGQPDPL